MRVSVVVPSFDRPEATAAAVRSALAQSVPVHEVIVVDDASDPPLAAETIAASDPRVRLIRLDANRGAAGARQAGIDAATGDVVAFLDSDDRWRPGKLAAQLPLVAPMVAVASGWEEVGPDGRARRVRVPVEAEERAPFLAGCWFCPGSTVLLRRADLLAVGPLDVRLGRLEDYEWFLRFALAGGRLRVAPGIGASIAIGARARLAPVRAASRRIAAAHAGRAELSGADRRALRAWLHVEQAKAAWNERRAAPTAWHLAASLLLRPRARLQLRRWWREG